MAPIDFKAAITQDIAEIDLALSVLNSLRDTNLARLALLHEAEKRAQSMASKVEVVNRIELIDEALTVLQDLVVHPFH
jgi:hypothetical protein